MSIKPEQLAEADEILRQLSVGAITKEELARRITGTVYRGLRTFCDIPRGYHHCRLATKELDLSSLAEEEIRDITSQPPGEIINAQPPHLQTVELFKMFLEGHPLVCENRNPMRPLVGTYLVGRPGVGKTHCMAAFGLMLQAMFARDYEELENKIATMVGLLFQKYNKTKKDANIVVDDGTKVVTYDASGNSKVLDPMRDFIQDMEHLTEWVRRLTFSPTDILYLGFEQLCQLYSDRDLRTTAHEALEAARVVFIDDVHPKRDQHRLEIVQTLIERRYELGRFGTFLTTNVQQEELGGGDANIAERLLSRCRESFVMIDFKDCIDWRQTIKARRIKLVEAEIARRLNGKMPVTSTG